MPVSWDGRTTGARALADADLENGWKNDSAAPLTLVRCGNFVYITANLDPSAATGPVVVTLPVGYGPATDVKLGVNSANGIMQVTADTRAFQIWQQSSLTSRVVMSFTYYTEEDWPTTYPGTAA